MILYIVIGLVLCFALVFSMIALLAFLSDHLNDGDDDYL